MTSPISSKLTHLRRTGNRDSIVDHTLVGACSESQGMPHFASADGAGGPISMPSSLGSSFLGIEFISQRQQRVFSSQSLLR